MNTRQNSNSSRYEPKDEPPRSYGHKATGEGRSAEPSTHSRNDTTSSNPQGRSVVDVTEAERTTGIRKMRGSKLRIGTWNVRSMSSGKLDVVKGEMTRCGMDILGVSEQRWSGLGHFNSGIHTVYYSGDKTGRRNGVGFMCSSEINKCVLGYNPITDRIISIRIQCRPINVSMIMVYAPTSAADDVEMMEFYEKVQEAVDVVPKGDILYILGDWNAKVGDEATAAVTGGFGLGKRNDRGEYLVEFCNTNN